MGYRSDVAYVVRFKNFQDRDAFVSLMLAKNERYMTEAIEECEYRYTTQPLITFVADSVKWYQGYEDVRAHNLILATALDVYNADYRFVEVGEDGLEQINDHDEIGDLYDYISTRHIIDIDFPLLHIPTKTQE
jgi:hypothetical protein